MNRAFSFERPRRVFPLLSACLRVERVSVFRLSVWLGFVWLCGDVVLGAGSSDKASPLDTVSSLQARLTERVSRPDLSAAALGMKIVSLETGKTLFEHNAAKLLKPASNAKLYTAALALDRLGPDFRIQTSLYAAARPTESGTLAGDLLVYGRGDPSFAARFNDGDYQKSLEPIVNVLVAAGVKRIEGNLVGDDSYFRGPPFGSSWCWDDLQYYYGAEVSALTVEDNVVDLIFKPGASVGEPCYFMTSPMTTFLTFINRTTTTPKESARRIDLDRPIRERRVYVSGQLPLGGTNWTDAVAVPHPAAWFVALLKDALERRGISVRGDTRSIDWRERETNLLDLSRWVELGTVESRPLREILGKMLKPSQNLYAQLLLLQVGARSEAESGLAARTMSGGAGETNRIAATRSGPSSQTTEDLGLAELGRFLQAAGLNRKEVLLEEGSGLSRGCLVTPQATVELLRFMSRHRHADVYREALPVAGVDGTLRNRLKQTKAAANARAKTGSLRYVDTLSGYLTTAGGESLAFSIMLNNFTDPRPAGRELIDGLVVTLADFAGTSRD